MPTYSIASALYMADDAGAFVGDPVEALRSVAASGYDEVELIAEGAGWEDGPPDSGSVSAKRWRVRGCTRTRSTRRSRASTSPVSMRTNAAGAWRRSRRR